MLKKAVSILLIGLMMFSVLCTLPASAQAETPRNNQYPIVLVHGMMGNDKMMGDPYWGGLYEIEKDLNGRGYTTYVASVGPFASNWDRACELYAEIKGGTVDYGKAHSEREGHARYGRTYPGLYPSWGDMNQDTGRVNKIHLIGHSMGGQTLRVLAQLLENGSAEEQAAVAAGELNPLFVGGKNWISGAISISTPHNGSTLKNDILRWFIEISAATAGGDLPGYDFGLDQWGLKRQPGECLAVYADRVAKSQIWTTSHDLCEWDLKPEGAQELNTWVKAQPDIYYFSVATSCTYRSLVTGHQLPRPRMFAALWKAATQMGQTTAAAPVVIDETWWENDGAANTLSMKGPFLASSDQIVNYSGTPQIGKWNYLGKAEATDHFAVIGHFGYDVRTQFRDYAALLGSLNN